MKYKDFGQGVVATVLLAGAAVMFLVSEGGASDQGRTNPVSSAVSSAVSTDSRQPASERFQRTSVDPGVRLTGAEQPSWVF
ncbi:hypothetical protein [Halopseudomonas pelagia]|uniref:hypothetical protein n=1 Tax=Halopseudomonas pelagia TaxID=553151 RepID=UPI0030D6CFB4|tara:strand:+ start:507 stop:749 length:243 start_codon:yes stop_codon:yes gene_type:complete